MREGRLKRKVACNINFTVIYLLWWRKESIRIILQVRSIDCKCRLMNTSFPVSTYFARICSVNFLASDAVNQEFCSEETGASKQMPLPRGVIYERVIGSPLPTIGVKSRRWPTSKRCIMPQPYPWNRTRADRSLYFDETPSRFAPFTLFRLSRSCPIYRAESTNSTRFRVFASLS